MHLGVLLTAGEPENTEIREPKETPLETQKLLIFSYEIQDSQGKGWMKRGTGRQA